MKFTIPGEPIAQKRAVTKFRNGCRWVMNPNDSEKQNVKKHLMFQIQQSFEESAKNKTEAFNLTEANKFHVNVEFYQLVPDSLSDTEKNAKLWGFCDLPPSKRDLDNFLKFILDCCTGILFSDDHLIVSLNSSKHYSNNPRTEIEIIPILEKSMSDEEKAVLCQFDPDELKELLNDIKTITNDSGLDKKDEESVEWLASKSGDIAKFATKYADKLKKIERKINKISGEGKTLC